MSEEQKRKTFLDDIEEVTKGMEEWPQWKRDIQLLDIPDKQTKESKVMSQQQINLRHGKITALVKKVAKCYVVGFDKKSPTKEEKFIINDLCKFGTTLLGQYHSYLTSQSQKDRELLKGIRDQTAPKNINEYGSWLSLIADIHKTVNQHLNKDKENNEAEVSG